MINIIALISQYSKAIATTTQDIQKEGICVPIDHHKQVR